MAAFPAGFFFSWTIENFSQCLHNKLSSPVFLIEALEQTKWQLVIDLTTGVRKYAFSIALLRAYSVGGPQRVDIGFEMSCFAPNGDLLFSDQRFFAPMMTFDSSGWKKTATRKAIFGKTETSFLSQDDLTICLRLWKYNTVDCDMGVCYARSRVLVERKTSVWAIERYSLFQQNSENRTILVQFDSLENLSLYMKLSVISCDNCDQKVHLELFKSSHAEPVFCTLKMAVLKPDGGIANFAQAQKLLDKDKWNFPLEFAAKGFDPKKELLLRNDTLFLRYDIVVSPLEAVHGIDYCSPSVKICAQQNLAVDASPIKCSTSPVALKDDLDRLFRKPDLSDFKIHVGCQTFSVHKTILGARSPFFKAMFSDEKENLDGFVDIDSLDEATVRQMLLFLYTDRVESLDWASAKLLFAAAVQFDISPLRQLCSDHFKANLCRANVCDLLSLPELNSDEDLTRAVQDFISDYRREVFSSEQWKEFAAKNEHLALKTMQYKYSND